jgi:antibiotic biosynthesis monooxygenase (ABM) superfamily enzyme
MESFFVTARAPDAPPPWKMAVLLLLAVYPVSLGVATWLAPAPE